MDAYRRLLQVAGVPRLFASVTVVRLTTSVLGLSMLLATHAVTGSYGSASLVLAAHALALAAVAPWLGRRADRGRVSVTLLAALVAHMLAYAAMLAALVLGAPVVVLVATAALIGGTTPPASAVVRGTWSRLVPADQLHTAYALDAASNEATFISGPLVVAAVASFADTTILIAASAITTMTGVLVIARNLAVRAADTPHAPTPGLVAAQAAGPLRLLRVRLVLTTAATGTYTLGVLQVAAAANATHWGATASAGLVLSALSVGALTGGLVYGARRWPGIPPRQLAILYIAGIAISAATVAAPNLVFLAGAFALFGLASGARESIEQLLLGEAGPTHQRTETFAWLNTFMWSGFALGTASAGQLTSRIGTQAPYLASATACLIGALIASRLLLRDTEPHSTRQAGRTPP